MTGEAEPRGAARKVGHEDAGRGDAGRGAAAELGEWIAALVPAEAGPARLDRMRGHLLDTLGVTVAGSGSEPARIARAVFDSRGDATVIEAGAADTERGAAGGCGAADGRGLADAAKCNAVAAHALELDDTEGCDHTGAVVVPAVLALAEGMEARPSGTDLLTAMVAGYEVGRRMQNALGGYEAHNESGWHSTATCGVFAAAAACAKLLRLPGRRVAHALAIAASSAGGTWAFAADGAMVKRFHPAIAAGAGLEAARLAARGATGPMPIFEDCWGGFFATHGNPDSRPSELVAGLGSTWHADHSAIKLYACCRSAHATLDGVLELIGDGRLTRDNLRSATLTLSPFLARMLCPSPVESIDAARMSLPTGIALALLGSPLSPEAFSRFARPEVAALREAVEVREDPEARVPSLVVRTDRGEFAVRRVEARGSQALPLTLEEIVRKFEWVTEPHLSDAGRAALRAYALGLDDSPLPELPVLDGRA
ncbi:MmgE/PrpD family protein [Leucobacter sp. CSA1]|uniref:MmgE/PrpD family protein n=1 Tax=Leucobacter chromiisoli TaxID=2796471 RepID=A0A934Q5E1_9MICO|nr:MmgE/PrpD family protein [Leucobacter chromiisoli]MBK0417911.1 MmgE/PrpD family protein [Leucobacter chromiisoli]